MPVERYTALLGRLGWCVLILAVYCSSAFAQAPVQPIETPSLEKAVSEGLLPPVELRLPSEPQIVRLSGDGLQPGVHGGSLRMLFGKQKDTRMVTIYGYARLLCYTPEFKLEPDILKAIDVDEDRVFTLHLRQGHRWSDGHPFTTEDFRYYWEDVANSDALFPGGPPNAMLSGGKPPVFEVIDETTVRFAWDEPNPDFMTWLAGSVPARIFRPAHYLKQFHAKYGDQAKIARLVEEEGTRDWAGLHQRKDRSYRADNPDLPTLAPWVVTVYPPSQRFVFTRNPYYHRIDERGRQIPYIDELVISLGSVGVIAAKTGAGDSDLQARYLKFSDYTFLKQAESRGQFKVHLWETLKTAHKALIPNLNAKDPVWRKVLRDVRFRRALSLAIHRREINQVLYYGLARESSNMVLPGSPLYKKAYALAWAVYDPDRANALLDEMGLTKRDDEGTRLLPDGRPIHIIIDSAGESTEESDLLWLVRDGWSKIGIKLSPRPSQREVFRNRVLSGYSVMSIWSIVNNGLARPWMSPINWVPSKKLQYQWPKWGSYIQSGGKQGQPPDIADAVRLVELERKWRVAPTPAARTKIWDEILRINSDQVFVIGLINGTLRPVVVNDRLRNVPKKGVYHWEPGGFLGVYKPDTFWFDPDGDASPASRKLVLPHSVSRRG